MSKPTPHLFRLDETVPADHRGKAYCRCGVVEDHPRHKLPDAPEQAGHRARYDHEEEGDQ